MEKLTRKDIAAIRKKIKARFPNLKFSIRNVSFQDLARDSAYFVESKAWGMTKGAEGVQLYQEVKALVANDNVIVGWDS